MRLLIYGDIGGSGGYIRYCKGLLSSKAIPKDIEIYLVISLPFYEKLKPIDQEIHVITHPWMISKSRLKRYLWYLWLYPRLVKKIKPDVEFYPSGQLRVYLRKACTISTCHNLLLFDPRELALIVNKEEKAFFENYRKNQTRSLIKSNSVIFLSDYSQKTVSEVVKNIKDSIVISHGLDPVFLQHYKRSYEIGNKVKLLYVSPIYIYKHQIEVIKAVKILKETIGVDVQLNLIGEGNPETHALVKALIKSENLSDSVYLFGHMEYEKLMKEYNSADIFIFASSCETFGITILEAMGSRLPIVCSNRTGLSEILKDSGIYFDPEIPDSIADALKKIILDRNLRETLGERAYQYAVHYSWERCALETYSHLKNLVK
ncbi:MAG: hypothetical protein CVT93_08510 [Bacteroidetes bacterium HGW-Bacteroidetes-10]|nr:MAG: hypothetical protein CVT93_08510 [Bacteroidetes bacterium HGW-Bacteroidetes-10]